MPSIIKAAIYARFSSEMQREESIDAQIRACEEFALAKGYEITKTYKDKALSGKSDKRPQFQAMIRESADFDVVLVHKYNRFARRMIDHLLYEEKLAKNGCELIAVAENFGSGKESIIMKSVMRAMSEYYLADLADEVRKGHKENALKAQHNGGYAPFGYDVVDKQFVINEFESMFVKKMFDCAFRKVGFSELIKEMEAAGIKGKRGKFIRYPSIYEILRNERYTGTYVYATTSDKLDRRAKKNAIRIEDAIPQIIPREIWEEVQRIMDAKKQSGRASDYLCKGIIYCAECGGRMTAHMATQRNEKAYFYCTNKECPTKSIHMEVVDRNCKEYVKKILSEDVMDALGHYVVKFQSLQKNETNDFNREIKKKIQEKEGEIAALMKRLVVPQLPDEVVVMIGEQISTTKREIEGLKIQKPPKKLDANQITHWILSIKEDLNSNNIGNVIEKVEITKNKEVKITSTLTSLTGISPFIGGDTQI